MYVCLLVAFAFVLEYSCLVYTVCYIPESLGSFLKGFICFPLKIFINITHDYECMKVRVNVRT